MDGKDRVTLGEGTLILPFALLLFNHEYYYSFRLAVTEQMLLFPFTNISLELRE